MLQIMQFCPDFCQNILPQHPVCQRPQSMFSRSYDRPSFTKYKAISKNIVFCILNFSI